MATTEVQKLTQAVGLRDQLAEGMQKNSAQFMAALGNDPSKVERWKTLLMMAVFRNPELAACDPGSLVASTLEAAQFGLEFGSKQHSYLVPFKGQCTFMPSYRGLIHAAKRSGETKDIRAEAVYEKDAFEYELGIDKTIRHKPAIGDRGALAAVYAVVKFADGSVDFEVMSKSQVDHIKGKSNSPKGPWTTDYDEMAKKTVIKRICKRLDMGDVVSNIISYDNHYEEVPPTPQMRMPEAIEEAK
jgi:recombination protein RecT